MRSTGLVRAGHSSACCKTCSHTPEGLLKERALPACVHSVNGQKPHRQTDSQHTHANRASCDEGEEASGRRGQRQEAHDQLSGVKTESRAVMRTGPGAPGMSAPSRPPAQNPGITSFLSQTLRRMGPTTGPQATSAQWLISSHHNNYFSFPPSSSSRLQRIPYDCLACSSH